MIIAVVGSGGKTTLIKKMAASYRSKGKTVLVTTTTHMFTEDETLLTDDADQIIRALKETGYAMAGIPEGMKIRALSPGTFEKVCTFADVVLVEADGSKQLPLKFPNETEPVIPENTDEILVVCGLNAIGQRAKDVCHRPELVKACLGIEDDTVITPVHIQKLITEGYVKPLRKAYPETKLTISARHDGSLYQRVIASLLETEQDVSVVCREWFCPQPKLFICGGGHVAKEVAALAAHLDYPVTVMDDRTDLANRERFPTAERIICDTYAHLSDYLEEDACYVVVTPDHKADLQCVRTILPTRYRYLGMMGSRKKVAATFQNLRNAGFAEDRIGTIFAPIGLPIGAVTPAEIAFSILGQIIQEKNKYHAASVDRALLRVTGPGMLCIITQKQGSAPRGPGSMMFVGEDRVLGTIGGGEPEYRVIQHAKNHPHFDIQEYALNSTAENGLDMICGGAIEVAFIPLT